MRQDEGEKERKVPGTNRRRLVVLGFGGCGRNIIYHTNEMLGTRDDVEVMEFQQRALAEIDPGSYRKLSWDDRTMDDGQLTMTEKCDRIDVALFKIKKEISDCDVLIIASGLGGLTGSYGSVKIAHLLARSNTKVIAFVVTPFKFERQRKFNPQVCLADLHRLCDVVVVASNDKLIEVAPKESLNAAFNRTRSLFEQMVRKVLGAGLETSGLVLDDPDGLAEIHINERSAGELNGMRFHPTIDLEPLTTMRTGSTDKEVLYRAYDEIYSKNDRIITKLSADLRLVRSFLVDEINKSNAVEEEEIDRQEYYQAIRDQLLGAFDDEQMAYHMPLDLSEHRSFVKEVVQHLSVIDVVIERLGSSLSNGPELAQNIKQYVEDYLNGVIGILEIDPQHMRKEIEKNLPTLHTGLRNELYIRAGVIDTSAFNDDRLLVSIDKCPACKGEWGSL